jgi:hypothetical protein
MGWVFQSLLKRRLEQFIYPTSARHKWGGAFRHRQSFVDCLRVGSLPPRAILVGGFSVPDWTPWLPGASLTCSLPIGSTPGVGIQSGRTLGKDVDAPRETEVARSDQLHAARGRTGAATAHGVSEAAMTEGRGGWRIPLPVISSHFETGRSRLVADLSGEWSRFGSF